MKCFVIKETKNFTYDSLHPRFGAHSKFIVSREQIATNWTAIVKCVMRIASVNVHNIIIHRKSREIKKPIKIFVASALWFISVSLIYESVSAAFPESTQHSIKSNKQNDDSFFFLSTGMKRSTVDDCMELVYLYLFLNKYPMNERDKKCILHAITNSELWTTVTITWTTTTTNIQTFF